MSSVSRPAVKLGNDVLQDWKQIGRGGFGAVYCARQKDWCFDVAIKMLHTNDSDQLWKEAQAMTRACSPFVLTVFGVYRGIPPGSSRHECEGIVIEYMKRGTLESLLERLAGPPPWPLAFRLAQQLALGMNFLHTLSPPLLHRDLKPSNVLLDDHLNAKLADFGLSRVSNSHLNSSGTTTEDQAGTLVFTPPEAFDLSYKPVRSYDIYSYGIVIWSVFTGKKPYSGAITSLVHLRVPLGDRPPTDEVDHSQADGLSDLVTLMERCWDHDPDKRPSFGDCLEVTAGVFPRDEGAIRRAVDQVLSKLDSEMVPSCDIAHCHSTMKEDLHKKGPVDGVKSTKPLSIEDKAKFVDNHRAKLIQEVSMVMAITERLGKMVHPETYSKIQAEDTNQDKLRVLYSTLHSGGSRVKAAFYDALETHEPDLLADWASRLG
ncbi:receptor-interacting serine/threonine-protein kinase 3-like [Gadus macrocephalus]|uniref:receptor-interacting serine/threonine-protein kinase 3-like n=1 Tax=Gadus macrocephalus TaxID=80720 RepID=UPI0028CB87B6|nr:receptor-interacting serine/threonine-protein kinase 3-like [Gadus macrocephalus]XP_059916152.1 receptor-interacting serine/threonine-protein kinase 3-like [Gadus macrocephalus]